MAKLAKKTTLFFAIALMAFALVACQPEIVEVTRVVETETEVEVTRVVTETVEKPNIGELAAAVAEELATPSPTPMPTAVPQAVRDACDAGLAIENVDCGALPDPTGVPTQTVQLSSETTESVMLAPTAEAMATGYPPVEATISPDPEPTQAPTVEGYKYPEGYTMAEEAVDITDLVDLRGPADDITNYACFPQDYSEGDDNNRGCQSLQENGQLPWDEPLAGFNYSYNAACRDVSRHCNIPIDTWKWVVVTGEEIFLPGVGSLRDANGGAVLAMIMNAWEIPGEWENAYVLHGYWATGETWDMSDLVTTWDEENETYTDNLYGHSVETGATLRDHFLNALSYNQQFRGQCSKGTNCETVTWVTGFRWFDGSFHITGYGQWERPTQ